MKTDPDDHLQTGHLQDDLRARSVSGAFVTLFAQWLKFALHFGSLLVLARILTPGDYGLVGMVTAVTGFVLLFKDLGLATATVQRAEVSQEQVSTLFWINVALSAAIMALTAALAPWIARFYDEPRLTWITLALAGGFLIGGLAVQHQALLSRQMRFRAMAVIEISAQAAAVCAALAAAWLGAGYWALVIQQLVLTAWTTAALWIACDWRPGPPVRASGVRPLLRFGGSLTAFNFVNYLARNVDDILIGRFRGAAALGLYARAYALLLMPLRQINAPVARIAIPTLSRLQDQPERYRRYYLNALRLVALACMPLVALLFVVSREVVLVVLGRQWIEAATLFSIMAVAAFVQPVLSTSGWVYVSLGQAGRMARWGALFALVYCASFVVGLPWGARGVAVAYTVAVYVLALPGMWAALRFAPVGLGDVARTVLRPAALGLSVALGAHAAHHWLPGLHPLLTIAVCAVAGAAAGLLLAALWPGLRSDLRGVGALLREIKGSKSG